MVTLDADCKGMLVQVHVVAPRKYVYVCQHAFCQHGFHTPETRHIASRDSSHVIASYDSYE